MLTPRFSLRTCGVSALAGALFLSGGTPALHAGAFSLADQSASAVGTSFSNMANPSDPGTLYFNPAGMTYLDGVQTESSYEYIHPSAKFENEGSRYLNPALGGLPISGGTGGGATRGASIDQTYITAKLFKSPTYGDFSVGIGASVPFGLVVDYDKNWVGRYDSQDSELRTADYDFSAAYRWKFLSVGAGFDAQYASAVLSQAIDFGLLGASLGVPGYAPGRNDGTLRLEGSDVSYGYNVGGLVEYLQHGQVPFLGSGKIGVSYRSGITQNIDGYATFRNVPAFLPAVGNTAFQGQRVTAKLQLPEIYNFALSQGILDDKVTLNAELTWTRWGRLSELPLSFSNPATAAALANPAIGGRAGLNTDYQDAFRYVGSIEFKPIKDLTLRVGGGYDETPVPNQDVRDTRIPDGNRWLISAGLKYHVFGFNSPIFPAHVDTDIELSYLHEFVNDPTITLADSSGHFVSGRYNEQVNVASASVVFRYGPKSEAERAKEGKDAKDRATSSK